MDKSAIIDEILRKWTLESPSGIIDPNKVSTFLSTVEAISPQKNPAVPPVVDINISELKGKWLNFLKKFVLWENKFVAMNKSGDYGTPLKETWPLYYTFKDNGKDYYSVPKNLVKEWYNLVNDVIGKEIDSFDIKAHGYKFTEERSFKNLITLFKERIAEVKKATGENNNATLYHIFNKTPTGFIHESIKEIRDEIVKNEKITEKMKSPTFDIILLYDNLNFNVLKKCISTSKANTDEFCLIDAIYKGKLQGHFALVSLKLGKARFGGSKKALMNIFNGGKIVTLNEGIVSNIASSINNCYKNVASGIKSVFDNIKKSWDGLKDDIIKFSRNIESIFSSGYKLYDEVDATYPEIRELMGMIEKINEATKKKEVTKEKEATKEKDETEEKDEFIYDPPIKNSTQGPFRNSFMLYRDKCGKDIEFAIESYNLIKSKEALLNSAGIDLNIDEIDKFVALIKTYKTEIVNVYNQIQGLEKIPKKDVYFITAFGSNLESVELLKKFINRISETTVDIKTIRMNYLSIVKVLAVTATYGSMSKFPLIKIEKEKIKKLGDKKNYEEKTFTKDIEDSVLKLGLIKIKQSTQTERRHLVIVFNMFLGLDYTETSLEPIYGELELRRDKETSFVTKVEISHVKTKEQVFGTKL